LAERVTVGQKVGREQGAGSWRAGEQEGDGLAGELAGRNVKGYKLK